MVQYMEVWDSALWTSYCTNVFNVDNATFIRTNGRSSDSRNKSVPLYRNTQFIRTLISTWDWDWGWGMSDRGRYTPSRGFGWWPKALKMQKIRRFMTSVSVTTHLKEVIEKTELSERYFAQWGQRTWIRPSQLIYHFIQVCMMMERFVLCKCSCFSELDNVNPSSTQH